MMLTIHPDFRELLALFNSIGVRYLIIGGYAVNFHGHHRNTKDIDLWIAVDPDNAVRVSEALQRFAFDAASVPPEIFLKRNNVIAFGRAPLRIDILTDPSGVTFDECYLRREEADLGQGLLVPFLSLGDLRINKAASGRTSDIADLDNLPGDSTT
jgi:hypothetical protein